MNKEIHTYIHTYIQCSVAKDKDRFKNLAEQETCTGWA